MKTYWAVPDDEVIPLKVTVETVDEDASYRLYRPGGVTTFNSARKLLIDLTGHPKARNWTFDRYFRTGRHAPIVKKPLDGMTVLDVLGWTDPPTYDPVLTLSDMDHTRKSGLIVFSPSDELTICETWDTELVGAKVSCGPKLGIDLTTRSHEVTKLLFAGFGHWISSNKYDPDDVRQEVYKGLLIRNLGKCPWDPKKASFGHYVHMVCGCILANYHRKIRRRRQAEQIGIRGWSDGQMQDMDASEAANDESESLDDYGTVLEDLSAYVLEATRGKGDGVLAATVLPYYALGFSRSEIAEQVSKPKATVSRALALLRALAPQWAA